MSSHEEAIVAAITALHISSARAFSWFGHRVGVSRHSSLENLRLRLQSHLYRHFYCAGRAEPLSDAALVAPLSPPSDWIAALSRANCGKACLEEGWKVLAVSSSSAVVFKDGLRFTATPDQLFRNRSARGIGVRLPKELLNFTPGFYLAVGNEPLSASRLRFRVYWNLLPSEAIAFMGDATRILNRSRIAFRLKVANDPARFCRTDAAVLYLHKDDGRRAYKAIDALYGRYGVKGLAPLTPVFAKAIAPGVAVAEQPPGDESFGQSRMALVARAFVASHVAGESSIDTRLDRVRRVFRQSRISMSAPYLNPYARDVYPRLVE